MNEDLKMLLEKREHARKYYEALGMMNVNGRTPESQIELDIAYERARMELMQAERNYHDAIAVAALSADEVSVYH
jgi:hypothetical protein